MNRPLGIAVFFLFCAFKLTTALLHAQYTVHVVCEVFICLHITDASVVIAPSHDYITFENNASTFTFNCSGNGAFLLWAVDGYTTGSSYVLNKGIQLKPFIVTPDGLTVSSQLIVPTTKANNNITVICTVQDSLFNHQSSNPVKLFLQGTVLIRMYLSMIIVIMISSSWYYECNRTK